MKKNEIVRNLAKKLRKGQLTPKEVLKRLEGEKLVENEALEFIPWVFYIVLWLLPTWSRAQLLPMWLRSLNPSFFRFFAQLHIISFPAIVIHISIVLLALGTFLLVWGCYSHYTRGGLKQMDETIILYRAGPYQVIRHPEAFGGMMWPILLPIILSPHIPFTILSIVAITIIVIYFYYGICMEEDLSTEKWGKEYQQYMKEIPRFNFILGLWKLWKRESKKR